jgi:hypothetical protein
MSAEIYGAFIDYYGDIALKRIKTEQGYNVYACRVTSGLSLPRYIFVVAPTLGNASSVTALDGETTSLNRLNWVSFQTRTSDENYSVPSVTILPTRERGEKLSDIVIATNRTANDTQYICESLPINLTMVHDQKKKNIYQYPDKCKLYQALESYNAVVEIL